MAIEQSYSQIEVNKKFDTYLFSILSHLLMNLGDRRTNACIHVSPNQFQLTL